MADDSVYVSDVNAGAVNILRDGKLVNSITVDARPHGLAVDTDGTVYVSDARGHKVIRIKQQ
jgi:glucose/arabinose dehydrogenase